MLKLLLVALVSSGLFAKFYDLKPITITKDVYCVIGDFHPPMKSNKGFVSNMCYVDMGETLVVLDAGPTYNFAKEFYTLMTKQYPKHKVSHVVLSNYHDDRIQGASYFKEKGAKIVGHITINDDINENKSKFQRMKMVLGENAPVLEGTKVILADTLVDDGYEIKGSKKTLTIIKPSEVSEEKSDIAIYSKDDSFLFVGNIVFNGRLLSYKKTSNVDGWIEALENLAKVGAKHYLGGHGDDYSADSYKDTLEYLQIMRDDVRKAYEDEVDSMDLTSMVKTDKFKHINHFKQLNYNNIQTYYQQLEWE
jgi:glyoxylase-like metal-dependent hydrolase (beta-lactamase superfamily II)